MMKFPGPVLTYSELTSFATWAQAQLEGAQLQEIWTNGEQIVFQFYKFKEFYFLVSLKPQEPRVALLKERPEVNKKSKPTTLFLNSHARNLRWEKLWTQRESGRVLFLSLTAKDKSCEIEIHLIPRNANLIVRSGDKQIAWEKPRELPPSRVAEETPLGEEQLDWWELSRQWWQGRQGGGTSSSVKIAKQDSRQRALEKKSKALEALRAQWEKDEGQRFQELGEALKSSALVPAAYRDLFQTDLSLAENMQRAFAKAKELRRKRQGLAERIEILKEEIEKLQADIEARPNLEATETGPPSVATRLMEKSRSKGRKKSFAEGIEAVLGKSAQDNLSLLRQAQPWHLWIHLKDEPGAHAIILRQRSQNVPPAVIAEVAEWVMRESTHRKESGVRYEVIVVECRYVRPIKGDRLGRVTYHHPQVFSFASK